MSLLGNVRLEFNITIETKGRARQFLASVTVTLAMLISGTFMGWPSPTLPLLLSNQSPLPQTSGDLSWMVPMMYIGNVLGSILCGAMMDKYGRKNTLLVMIIPPILSWLLILFTRTVSILLLARFLCGIWLGVSYTVVPLYIGEIAEPKIRGTLTTFFGLMTYIGVLFEYIVGPYVTYNTLSVASLSFCFIFVLSFAPMYESPYYFVKENKMDEAKASLIWFKGGKSEVDVELEAIVDSVRLREANKGNIKDLFLLKGNRKAFFIVGVLSILHRASGISAYIAYASTTLPKSSLSFLTRDECVIILGVVLLFSSLVSTFIVDRIKRKALLVLSSLGCSASFFMAGLWFYLDEKTDTNVLSWDWCPFASFVSYGLFYSIGINPIITTIRSELFSPQVKGLASALTTIIMALTSAILNKYYQTIADNIGMYFNYLVFTFGNIFITFFTLTYVIETKGKTLQEIQEKLFGVRADKSTGQCEYDLTSIEEN